MLELELLSRSMQNLKARTGRLIVYMHRQRNPQKNLKTLVQQIGGCHLLVFWEHNTE